MVPGVRHGTALLQYRAKADTPLSSLGLGLRHRDQLPEGNPDEGACLCTRTGVRRNHRQGGALNEAVQCRESGEKKVIAFNLSGHGHFDMSAYADYHAGKLERYEYPAEAIERAMQKLPEVIFAG